MDVSSSPQRATAGLLLPVQNSDTKLIIIFLFQFIKATSEVCVRGKHRSEAHDRLHASAPPPRKGRKRQMEMHR